MSIGTEKDLNIIKLKLELLLHGISLDETAFKDVGTKYREEVHWLFEWDKSEHNDRLSPSELIFEENEMIVQIYENPESPYKLSRTSDDQLNLEFNGKILDYKVKYPDRPKLFTQTTSDGIPFQKVVGFRGVDCLSMSFSLFCKFWLTKEECKFCNINTTKNLSEQKAVKHAEWLSEAVAQAYKNKEINHFIITGGTFEKEIEWVNRIFDKIKEKTGMNFFPQSNCTMTAPRSEEDLKTMCNYGSDFLSFNLEIWNKTLFKELCPGKNSYVGYDNWVKILIKGVEYKGWGHIRSNFVAGLEPIESLKEGANFLASNGVLPAFIPFKKPFSPNIKSDYNFSKEDYWHLTEYFVELYDKYNLKPSYCHKCYCNSTYIDYYTFFSKNKS